jgi:chromosome segregation ATPase
MFVRDKMDDHHDDVLLFNDMFREVERSHSEKPYSYADQVMENIEKEYKQPQQELNEREKEKKALHLKMGELKRRLRQSKNIRNVSKASINQTLAQKRQQIRAEMEKIKDRLYQIEIEEKGMGVSSKDLTDSTLKQSFQGQ